MTESRDKKVLKEELRTHTLDYLITLLKKEIKVCDHICYLRIFPNIWLREYIWSVCYVREGSEEIMTRCDNVDFKEAVIDAIVKY